MEKSTYRGGREDDAPALRETPTRVSHGIPEHLPRLRAVRVSVRQYVPSPVSQVPMQLLHPLRMERRRDDDDVRPVGQVPVLAEFLVAYK